MFSLHLPTVNTIGIAVMLFSAVTMTLLGHWQLLHSSIQWWAGAQWLATVGLLLLSGMSTLWDPQWALPTSTVLLLQWPMLILWGLRRFFDDVPLVGSARTDIALLMMLTAVWFAVWCSEDQAITHPLVLASAMAALQIYTAWVLLDVPRACPVKAPIRLLQLVLISSALIQASLLLASFWDGIHPTQALASITLPLALNTVMILLLCTVLIHSRTARDLRESRVRLRTLAHTDALTHTPNRHYFRVLADRLIARAHQSPALMVIDIDHLKQVNDAHGHDMGDEALKLVAQCIRQALRPLDIVGRLGSDEFVVLMPATTTEVALRMADRLLRDTTAVRSQKTDIPRFGLSFGVVRMGPRERFEDALQRADLALAQAKRQGSGRAVTVREGTGKTVLGDSHHLGLSSI